jgi:hypothetical protein
MLKKLRLAGLVAIAIASPAWAQQGPETVPNGPSGENGSLASLRSYEQLTQALESAARTSGGCRTW